MYVCMLCLEIRLNVLRKRGGGGPVNQLLKSAHELADRVLATSYDSGRGTCHLAFRIISALQYFTIIFNHIANMGLCERHFRGKILTFADVIFLIDCESI